MAIFTLLQNLFDEKLAFGKQISSNLMIAKKQDKITDPIYLKHFFLQIKKMSLDAIPAAAFCIQDSPIKGLTPYQKISTFSP